MPAKDSQTIQLTAEQIINILNLLVPFLSALILFYLASCKENRITKTDVYKERLQNYYIPFYQMYCKGFLTEYPIEEMDLANRRLFLDLFSNNIQYMDRRSQSLYPEYYHAFLNLLEAEISGVNDLATCQSDFSNIFLEITRSTFSEYKRLLRKLKMPVPDI